MLPHGGIEHGDGVPEAWGLLDITRRIRTRERRELTDFLHDGPIQELTAASLDLQMQRRLAPPSPASRLDSVEQLVEAAAGSLRWLVDGPWPFVRPETQLAAALQQRIGWLLAAPVTVDSGEQPSGPTAMEAPIVVDVVELMLLGMAPTSPLTQARVAVRAEEQLIHIQLTLTAAAEDDETIGDQATARESLSDLATALRASADSEFSDRLWLARIALHRHCASMPEP